MALRGRSGRDWTGCCGKWNSGYKRNTVKNDVDPCACGNVKYVGLILFHGKILEKNDPGFFSYDDMFLMVNINIVRIYSSYLPSKLRKGSAVTRSFHTAILFCSYLNSPQRRNRELHPMEINYAQRNIMIRKISRQGKWDILTGESY